MPGTVRGPSCSFSLTRALSPDLLPLGLQSDLVGSSVGSGFSADPGTVASFLLCSPGFSGPVDTSERKGGREKEGD